MKFVKGHFPLDELIRQVTINCAERGLLLLRVRDEIRMTVAAYQTLYESRLVRYSNQVSCTAMETIVNINYFSLIFRYYLWTRPTLINIFVLENIVLCSGWIFSVDLNLSTLTNVTSRICYKWRSESAWLSEWNIVQNAISRNMGTKWVEKHTLTQPFHSTLQCGNSKFHYRNSHQNFLRYQKVAWEFFTWLRRLSELVNVAQAMLIVILFSLFNKALFSHQFKIFVVEVGQSAWELV